MRFHEFTYGHETIKVGVPSSDSEWQEFAKSMDSVDMSGWTEARKKWHEKLRLHYNSLFGVVTGTTSDTVTNTSTGPGLTSDTWHIIDDTRCRINPEGKVCGKKDNYFLSWCYDGKNPRPKIQMMAGRKPTTNRPDDKLRHVKYFVDELVVRYFMRPSEEILAAYPGGFRDGVPRGYTIMYKDGNPANPMLSNLIVVPGGRAEAGTVGGLEAEVSASLSLPEKEYLSFLVNKLAYVKGEIEKVRLGKYRVKK